MSDQNEFPRISVVYSCGTGSTYTYINNEFLQDPHLSYKAKGFGAYMLSLGASAGPFDRDDVEKVAAELQERGYLRPDMSGTLVMNDRRADD